MPASEEEEEEGSDDDDGNGDDAAGVGESVDLKFSKMCCFANEFAMMHSLG